MKIKDIEKSLYKKYLYEPLDDDTIKHMAEDVRSIHPSVTTVHIMRAWEEDGIKLKLGFATQEDAVMFALKWS